MAANDIILTAIFVQNGLVAIKNTDGTNDILAGQAVVLDTATLISSSNAALAGKLGGAGGQPLGVAIEKIAKGTTGRIATGYMAFVPAQAGSANSGVITADDWVEGDATGQFKTTAGGVPTYGKALTTTAAQGDQFLLGVTFAKEA